MLEGTFLINYTSKSPVMKKYLILFSIVALVSTACHDQARKKDDSGVGTPQNTKSSPEKSSAFMLARPDSVTINASNTAVIVIDMENDFGSKGGMFDRAGADISMIQGVVAPTAKVLEAARQADIPIIYLKMGYHEDLSDLGREGSKNRIGHIKFMHVGDTMTAPDGSKGRILVRDTWGTDIIPALKPQSGDLVIYKTRFSCFYNTALDSILKKSDKTNLIITGCTTSLCVESTVRDAMFRDYAPIVLEDCTGEAILPRSNHEASLLAIERVLGWVSNSDEFIKATKKISNNSTPSE